MIGVGNQGADLRGFSRFTANFQSGKWAGTIIEFPGARAGFPGILGFYRVEKEMDVVAIPTFGEVFGLIVDGEAIGRAV